MTHEEHHRRHVELHQALTELLEDWLAHHAEARLRLEPPDALWAEPDASVRTRLLDRPIRDLTTWSRAQTIHPLPLADDLHLESTSAAHEPCDAECGVMFRHGAERCRHLRTAEEWLRTR